MQIKNCAKIGQKLNSVKKHILQILVCSISINSAYCTPEILNYFIKTDSSENLLALNDTLSSLQNCIEERTNPRVVALTELTTFSGINFDALFFDRNSKNVMILGSPFPCSKEEMLYYVELFEDYDIIIFDYRWASASILSYLVRLSTLVHPLNSFIFEEQEEITTVLEFINSKKNYAEIIGLGECYSNFLFIMAQAYSQKNSHRLFTKLILDSCWLSFAAFAESISFDPMLPISPVHGGCPNCIKSILNNSYVHSALTFFIDVCVPRVDICDYINSIYDTPLLFIHGINDKMVPLEHFNQIWHAIPTENTQKAALITPYQHCNNMRNKTLYKNICSKFIESNDINAFIEQII